MWWWLSSLALAGYGDAVGGVPDVSGRAISLWVNAVRVDPEAFEAEYNAGGCSYYTDFSASEQTPKTPYRVHQDLLEAAAAHTEDMAANSWFSHTSSDGTRWDLRVSSFYPTWTALAENIAFGFDPDPRSAVTENWMCSAAGHRGSIMSTAYQDLGGAHAFGGATYYATLDFASGAGGTFRKVRIGAHEPPVPTGSVTFRADWTDGGAPDTFEVVLDGDPRPLALEFGTASNGVYTATVAPDASACHRYFFRAVRSGVETRWPETGSYGWGACTFADPVAGWLDSQVGPLTSTQSGWPVGGQATLTVTGAVPGETVRFLRGTAAGPGPCPAQIAGTCLDIGGSISLLGAAVADPAGTATLTVNVPSRAAPGFTVRTQAVVSDGVGNWTAAPALTGTTF